MEVQIEFSFRGVELLGSVSESLEYPHKSCHRILIIMKFHIFNDIQIEKSTRIVEVTCNQGFSVP